MRLIPLYCHDCPGTYVLPDGLPDQIWFWGKDEPPKRLGHHNLVGQRTPMDRDHDYRWNPATAEMRYSYSGGEGCWIVLQYGVEEDIMNCHQCLCEMAESANYCPDCGVEQ